LIFAENNGALSNIGGRLMLAYHLPIDQANLSAGGYFSYTQTQINAYQFEPYDKNDPLLNGKVESYSNPDYGFGLAYSQEGFNGGVSANGLLKQSKNPFTNNHKLPTKFIAHASYFFQLTKALQLEPSFVMPIITDNNTDFIATLQMYFLKYNWVAAAYNYNDYYKIYLSFKFSKLNFGYCYTYLQSDLSSISPGNHQFFMGINIGSNKVSVENIGSLSSLK
jgi:type IX secretion system PorP/SprF family membrane protein